MSKKHKMGWTSNTPSEDMNSDFLYSDDALDALINQQYGPKSVDRSNASSMMEHTPQEASEDLDLSPLRKMMRDTANEMYQDTMLGTTIIGTTNQQPTAPARYEELVGEMVDGSSSTLPSADNTEKVAEPVRTESKPDHVCNCKNVNNTLSGKPHVTIEKIHGCDHIVITDGYGSCAAIPIARESDPEVSYNNLLKNLAILRADTLQAGQPIPDDIINTALEDLCGSLSKVQILWGRPTFVEDIDDLDDEAADARLHAFNGLKMVLLDDSVKEDNLEATTVFGYMYTSMDDLFNEWKDIIFKWRENADAFDRLLSTLSLLYQIMYDQRYISHGELGEAIKLYTITNDYNGRPRSVDTIMNEAPALPDSDKYSSTFNIEWESTIKEAITGSIDDAMIDECYNIVGLFTDHQTSEGDENNEEYNETDDAGSPEETSNPGYAESMAAAFAAQYAESHPDVHPVGGPAPVNTGYVRNAESVGAPVGEENFRSTGDETINTEASADDHHDAPEGGNSDGPAESDNTETYPDDAAREEAGNSNNTADRSWDPYQSFYEKRKEETQKEKVNRPGDADEQNNEKEKEEVQSDRSDKSDGIKHVQKETEKVDDDDLIIPVVRG